MTFHFYHVEKEKAAEKAKGKKVIPPAHPYHVNDKVYRSYHTE